jgi:chromosome segregation ATPase
VDIATEAEARATRAKQDIDRLDAALTRAQDQVVGVEREVQAFGNDVEENKPLLTAISNKAGIEIGSLVDSAREIMTTVRETVTAVGSAIEAINAISFISIPVPELEKMDELSQDVDYLRTEVQDLRTTIDQKRSKIIQGAVSIVTTPTSQIGSTLGEMQAAVSGLSQRLGVVQERLSKFKSSIGGRLTWVALVLTLILLWIAFSQAGLLVLGWRFFSG